MKKQHKDQNTLSQIHIHLSNQILQDVLKGKNHRYFMVKVGAIVHDEKSNQQVAFEAVTVFSSYDRRYIFRRSLNCL